MGYEERKDRRKETRQANKADRQAERQGKRALRKAVRKGKKDSRRRELDRDPAQILLNNEFEKGKRLYGSGANQILKQLGGMTKKAIREAGAKGMRAGARAGVTRK